MECQLWRSTHVVLVCTPFLEGNLSAMVRRDMPTWPCTAPSTPAFGIRTGGPGVIAICLHWHHSTLVPPAPRGSPLEGCIISQTFLIPEHFESKCFQSALPAMRNGQDLKSVLQTTQPQRTLGGGTLDQTQPSPGRSLTLWANEITLPRSHRGSFKS